MDIAFRLRVLGKSLPYFKSIDEDKKLCEEAADEIERLREAIKVQANAVRSLHYSETTEINRLRKTEREAHIAIKTLDSERKANAILTDEIERLREALSYCACVCEKPCGKHLKQNGQEIPVQCTGWIARSALQQKESE